LLTLFSYPRTHSIRTLVNQIKLKPTNSNHALIPQPPQSKVTSQYYYSNNIKLPSPTPTNNPKLTSFTPPLFACTTLANGTSKFPVATARILAGRELVVVDIVLWVLLLIIELELLVLFDLLVLLVHLEVVSGL
jgi:hypothetical protein